MLLTATMLAATSALDAQSAPARTPPPSTPSAPHERLGFFEGVWTVEEVPAARGFRERCGWMEGGRRHMVCRSRSMAASGEWREGMSMFSYRPADSAYVYYGLRPSGVTQLLVGRVVGEGWEFEGDERDVTGRLRTRVRITRLPNGRFKLVEQTARGDAPFAAGDSVHYRAARPEPGAP